MEILEQWRILFPELLPGLVVSLQITALTMLFAMPLSIVLAVGVRTKKRAVRYATFTLVEIGRGMPGLVMLYLIYYGGAQQGIVLSSFAAAVVGLTLNGSAYMSEIIRGGLVGVPSGQRDAARALGLSPWKQFRLVILPQALKIVVPPLIGYGIIIFQATSLCFAISTRELLSRAYDYATITFQWTASLSLAGLLYVAVSLVGVALIRLPRKQSTSRPARVSRLMAVRTRSA